MNANLGLIGLKYYHLFNLWHKMVRFKNNMRQDSQNFFKAFTSLKIFVPQALKSWDNKD